MTHFLRNHRNRSLVDIETTDNDIRSVICIREYSELLLNTDVVKRNDLVNTFHGLQEIRGAWYENVAHRSMSPHDYVRKVLTTVAEVWGLDYVVD